jgi:hypothetical protein
LTHYLAAAQHTSGARYLFIGLLGSVSGLRVLRLRRDRVASLSAGRLRLFMLLGWVAIAASALLLLTGAIQLFTRAS